tara:strand:+ start:34299 stop:37301 length:3003 start_codon:yes stop_codon:yes gene_type:complete
MAGEKNFNIKNGLSVGGVEVINSSGDLVAGGVGTAVNEAIADKIGGIVSATGAATATYNDSADTIVIDVPILDSDTMSGASATTLSSSESIKAYVDSVSAAKDDLSELGGDSDDVTEGSTNLYFTNARADARVAAASDLVRTTGTQTIAGAKTFSDNAVFNGNLTVNGTQTSVNTETLTVDDNMIVLNNNESGTPSQDAGVEVERGTSTNVKLQFKESTDKWQFTNDGSSYVDLATDTDTLSEGSSNLYYTDARVDARTLNTTQTLTNKTLTSPVLNTTVSGSAIKDEDNMSSNSADHLATQQSIKAYVDASILTKDNTDEITEGSSNLYHTTARARSAISASGDLSYNSSTGVISFTNDAGDIEGVTAGDGLSGGGSSGTVALALDLNELTAATVAVGADSIAIIDASDNTSKKESIVDLVAGIAGSGLSASGGQLSLTDTGFVTGVTAGDGLSGGGTEGTVSLAVSVDDSSIETSSDTLRVKAGGITNAMLAGSIANSNLANSSVTVNGNAVALGASTTLDTGDIAENGNLYHTSERVDDRVNALITAGTNITTSYDDSAGTLTINSSGKTQEEIEDIVNGLVVGGTNITSTYDDANGTLTLAGLSDANIRGLVSASGDLSYNSGTGAFSFTERTDAEVRGLVSVTDAGGDGSLAYNSSSGAITYTGPSASEVRAHLSAGTGVSYSGGAISIGQAVATGSNVAFNDLTLAGNLVVNGSTVTANSTNTTITDGLIELGNGTSGTPSNDTGIIIERGTAANAFIGFDESADKFTMGTTTATGASTGNLSITAGTLVANLEGSVTGTVSSISNHSTSDLSEGSNLYLTTERVQDIAGGMFTGNTESGITVTYNDGDGTVDFTVGTLNQSTTGNAGTATALQTARTINGVSFDGTGNVQNTTAQITESGNLYHTTARARGALSHSAGTGAYNSSTGVITSPTHTSHLTNNSNFAVTGSSAAFTTLTTTSATNSGGIARNVYQSTGAPQSSDGIVGDLWIQYS